MFCAKYLVLLSTFTLFNAIDADSRGPVVYAQDYCQQWTIDHKVLITEELPSVIVRAHRGSYRPNRDCELQVVNADEHNNTGLNVIINRIELRKSIRSKDYLVIKFDKNRSKLWFDRDLVDNKQMDKFFMTNPLSDSNEVVIKFLTTIDNHNLNDDKGFEILITLIKFKDIDNKDKIGSDEDRRIFSSGDDIGCDKKFSFDCGNDICINRRLVCNGVDNCGNGNDEPDNCKHNRNNNYFDFFDSGFWFGFKIVASLLLIGILLGIVSCICKTYDENKHLRKQLLIEELKRHSGYRLRNNSIFSLNQKKTPLYPQLYRTYGGTEA